MKLVKPFQIVISALKYVKSRCCMGYAAMSAGIGIRLS